MNKYALVTGAGSGIGRACALGLLADGWHVALLGRRVDALEATAEAAAQAATQSATQSATQADSSAASRALVLPCNVADDMEVAIAFAAIKERFGRDRKSVV